MNDYGAAMWYCAETERQEKLHIQTALLNIKDKLKHKTVALMHQPVGTEVSINILTEIPGIQYRDLRFMCHDLMRLAEITTELYYPHISVEYDQFGNKFTLKKIG